MAPTAAEMAMSMMGAADVNAGSELATRAVMEANGDAQREQVIVEAWAQGFNVGAVVTLILFVMCNYRRGVMLHALILVEVGSLNHFLHGCRRKELEPVALKLTPCFIAFFRPTARLLHLLPNILRYQVNGPTDAPFLGLVH